MKKFWRIFIIGLYFQLSFSQGEGLEDDLSDLDTPEDLSDGMDGVEWQNCEKGETCLAFRKHACTEGKSIAENCGMKVWKEELVGCHRCAGGWLKKSGWSGCRGTGCDDTIQQDTYSCSNTALQPNCQLIRTRFCDRETVCNGTWSEWKSDSPSCYQQCGQDRRRVLFRKCLRAGQSSGGCGSGTEHSGETGLIETSFDDCSKEPCTTTAKTTTQAPQFTWTAWSDWSTCSATCDQLKGKMSRRRDCIYTNGLDADESKCPNGDKSKETEACSYNGPACEKPTTAVVIAEKASTKPPSNRILVVSPSFKNLEIKIPKEPTTNSLFPSNKDKYIGKNQTTTQSTEDVKQNENMKQYQMLVIVIATAVCLIILVIIIFLCCRKKSTKGIRKQDISIVALQAHSGFTDGGEFERLRKTAVTANNYNLPNDQNQNNIANFNMAQQIPETPRKLPEIPLSTQNSIKKSDHIYEDMIVREKRVEESSNNQEDIPTYRSTRERPSSYHDRQRASTIVTREFQSRRPLANKMRTRSLHGNSSSGITPRRKPPPKPPRKSMILLDSEIKEFRETPLSLYESGKRINASSPELFHIINSIPPPAYSPPETPIEDQALDATKQTTNHFLTLPEVNLRKSKSTPSSPNIRHSISADFNGLLSPIPLGNHQSNFLSSPLLISQPGIQFMVPTPASNGGVILLPVSPIYSTVTRHQASPTPLHAITVDPSPGPVNPPEISISVPDKGISALSTPSPRQFSAGYADMRCAFGNAFNYNEDKTLLPQSRSLNELHGTHNRTPAKEVQSLTEGISYAEDRAESLQEGKDKSLEDCNGYLLPKYPSQKT